MLTEMRELLKNIQGVKKKKKKKKNELKTMFFIISLHIYWQTSELKKKKIKK